MIKINDSKSKEVGESLFTGGKEKVLLACKEAGVEVRDVYKALKEGLTATKVITNKFGSSSEEDDYATRHKYMVTALELFEHLKDRKEEVGKFVVDVNMKKEDVDRLEGIARDLDQLEKRLRGDMVARGLSVGEVVDFEVHGN